MSWCSVADTAPLVWSSKFRWSATPTGPMLNPKQAYAACHIREGQRSPTAQACLIFICTQIFRDLLQVTPPPGLWQRSSRTLTRLRVLKLL